MTNFYDRYIGLRGYWTSSTGRLTC